MGRQSPTQLKCHCVLKTGVTDVFLLFEWSRCLSVCSPVPGKETSFHFSGIYSPRLSRGQALQPGRASGSSEPPQLPGGLFDRHGSLENPSCQLRGSNQEYFLPTYQPLIAMCFICFSTKCVCSLELILVTA